MSKKIIKEAVEKAVGKALKKIDIRGISYNDIRLTAEDVEGLIKRAYVNTLVPKATNEKGISVDEASDRLIRLGEYVTPPNITALKSLGFESLTPVEIEPRVFIKHTKKATYVFYRKDLHTISGEKRTINPNISLYELKGFLNE